MVVIGQRRATTNRRQEQQPASERRARPLTWIHSSNTQGRLPGEVPTPIAVQMFGCATMRWSIHASRSNASTSRGSHASSGRKTCVLDDGMTTRRVRRECLVAPRVRACHGESMPRSCGRAAHGGVAPHHLYREHSDVARRRRPGGVDLSLRARADGLL